MNNTIEVLRTVLPVVLMLSVGMLCRSRKLLSREGVNALKSVVVNITLPAVLLNAFAATQYTLQDVVIPLMMFAVCLAAWLLGCAAARLFRMPSRFVPFLTTGFEAGMLGFGFSLMLETLQLIFMVGSFDVDDMQLNTLGAALGYLAYRFVQWARVSIRRRRLMK